MTTDEPLQLTVNKMNRVMDEIETLLARREERTGAKQNEQR